MRLFFAAMLPHVLQRKLGKLREKLDWLPVSGKWTAADKLHLTLKFLGDVEDAEIPAINASVGEHLPKAGPVHLWPTGFVYFPEGGAARVLAVGFAGQVQKLLEVQRAIEAACEVHGFAPEGRGFVPHATLARFNDGLRPQHRPRVEALVTHWDQFGAVDIEQVQLVQSVLSDRGSEYAILARWPL